jgi:hypothetical protein
MGVIGGARFETTAIKNKGEGIRDYLLIIENEYSPIRWTAHHLVPSGVATSCMTFARYGRTELRLLDS